jgi:hypothetical protein
MRRIKVFLNGRLSNEIIVSHANSVIIEVDDEIVFDKCDISPEIKPSNSVVDTLVTKHTPDKRITYRRRNDKTRI